MKKKSMLIIAILLMSIGFAAISTTLVINGNAKISENEDDFSVIFTAATLDGRDVYSTVVDSTKKIITFETSELKTLNQKSVLTYAVTNNSSNYDAEISVTCVPKDGTTVKYTSIKNKLDKDATIVKTKTALNGTLTVTLDKTSTEEATEEYTCKLEFNAVERKLGIGGPYYAFGEPTTSSTTDYTTLGKNVFTRLGTDGSKATCMNDNGVFCIKINDYDNSVIALKNHFGESACSVDDYSFFCNSDLFNCDAMLDGEVECMENSTQDYCDVYPDGDVDCS